MTGIRLHDKPVLKLEIILGLAWARFLVRFVPFAWWRNTLGPIGSLSDRGQQAQLSEAQARTATGIGRVIAKVGHRMPFNATCLPRAMTARWMLRRRGISSQMLIGSKRNEDGGAPQFHAWLVCGNDIVTGGEVSAEYSALGQFHEASD